MGEIILIMNPKTRWGECKDRLVALGMLLFLTPIILAVVIGVKLQDLRAKRTPIEGG